MMRFCLIVFLYCSLNSFGSGISAESTKPTEISNGKGKNRSTQTDWKKDSQILVIVEKQLKRLDTGLPYPFPFADLVIGGLLLSLASNVVLLLISFRQARQIKLTKRGVEILALSLKSRELELTGTVIE